MGSAAWFALLAACLLGSPRAASAQTAASEIFARVAPSVAVVEAATGHGTGILLDQMHVMTDASVVGDGDFVNVRFPDGATPGRVVVRDRLANMAVIELFALAARRRIVTIAVPAVPPPLEPHRVCIVAHSPLLARTRTGSD